MFFPKTKIFENFLTDMGERPAGMSIDRIDNDKLIDGYCKDNCRWATPTMQIKNQRRFKKAPAATHSSVLASAT